MELKNILAYQEVDKKLFALEQSLAKDPNKQKCNQLNQTARDSQVRSGQLEEQASAILKEMDELQKTIASTKKHGQELLKLDPETLQEQELDEAIAKKDRVASNLIALDRRLTKLAENINQVLSDFNRTIKLYNEAKSQYQKYKAAYDAKLAETQPKMEALKSELEKLAKSVDAKTLDMYKAKRADRIFPVFVELIGNACGRCRMELSASAVSKLKTEHILTCENCRSIIYSKD